MASVPFSAVLTAYNQVGEGLGGVQKSKNPHGAHELCLGNAQMHKLWDSEIIISRARFPQRKFLFSDPPRKVPLI